MYEWDRKLLYRAVDLELKAAERGMELYFTFPYYSGRYGEAIDFIAAWVEGRMEHAETNEKLSSMLGRLEKGKRLAGGSRKTSRISRM